MCQERPPPLPLLNLKHSPEPNRSSCRSVYEISPAQTYNFNYEQCHSESDELESKMLILQRAIGAKEKESGFLIDQVLVLNSHSAAAEERLRDMRQQLDDWRALLGEAPHRASPRLDKLAERSPRTPRKRKLSKARHQTKPEKPSK